jgi:hypothetical protein
VIRHTKRLREIMNREEIELKLQLNRENSREHEKILREKNTQN